jgi:hypothetical protein
MAIAPPKTARRLKWLAPDVKISVDKRVDVSLPKQTRITRQGMFEACQRKTRCRQSVRIAARKMRMQHTGGKSIACANAVDNAGDINLIGLRKAVAQIDTRGQLMMIGTDEMPRGRRNQF